MHFSVDFYALVAVMFSLQSVAMAGAGAFVNGCIAVPQSQASELSFDVSFRAGGASSSCMSSQGNRVTNMTVTKPGITCTYLGYVEAKGTGICFFKSGKWDLSYNDTRGTSGGKTRTAWAPASGHYGNTVDLFGYSPRTRICKDKNAVCAEGTWGPSVEWKKKTQGPIFIIFQPFMD